MRFLRMRPAVWAMISCSFSSLTLKVAFGSNSVTTPGNSRSSSFAIRCPASRVPIPDHPARKARNLAESGPSDNWSARVSSFVAALARGETCPDPLQQLVAHVSVRIHALLPAALDRGRVGGGPVFHVERERARELERLVMRFGRERDDEVEIEPLQILELLEGHGTVRLDVDADLVHDRGREWIKLAFAHAGRSRNGATCRAPAAAARPPSASARNSGRRRTALPAAA